jgi:hypothetical protein
MFHVKIVWEQRNMTIEDRVNRLEHFTAGLDDQARRDREESRQLWRETQQEILTVSRRLVELADQFLRFQTAAEERDRKAEERDRKADERYRQLEEQDRRTDERIQALVSAVGELIRNRKS